VGYEEARTEQEEADKCKDAAHTEQAAQGQAGASSGVAGHQTQSGSRADGITLKGMRRMTQSMFGDEAHATT
jgi:hypothetical protein